MGIALAVVNVSRLLTLLWLGDRLAAVGLGNLPFILLQGLRFDVVTLGIFFAIPILLTPMALVSRALAPYWLRILCVYTLAVILFMSFMELATPSFINEFDAKPDRRFITYLIYPREVFATLWGAYKWPLIFSVLFLLAMGRTTWRYLWPRFRAIGPLRPWAPLFLVPLCALASLAAIRSTNDHRPVNSSTVVFSVDPLANQFALNSSYTVLEALYQLSGEQTRYAYRSVPSDEAVAAAQAAARLDSSVFLEPGNTTQHLQVATRRADRPLNLVIILEESLGAEFVGALGGLPLTPELDKLQPQGIWFDHLYATGVRSVRGIEAVVSGFPPTTAESTVKRPGSQRDFFTIAGLLAQRGYRTSFLYGGEPQFDNMGRFFANNGFQTIVGRHDFGDGVFEGAWGVDDEDLFSMAHELFRAQPKDRPFFSLIFTSSNHSPWDFPAGKIELYEQPASTRNNAVKYADYALGKFIRAAQESEYWANTVFLIIADHCSRVYGAELVPVEQFHIPGVILGAGVTAERISRVVSQIDMLPTLLSLAGIDSVHPNIGIDQTRKDLGDFPGRAVMQYGVNQAYMEGEHVVVLQPERAPAEFLFRDRTLVPEAPDARLIQQAEAFAFWPWISYRQSSYSLPLGGRQ